MVAKKDLTGKTFHFLEILGRSHLKDRWICRCLRCGTVKHILASCFMRKHLPVKSCGCYRKELREKQSFKTKYVSSRMFCRIRQLAKDRGIPFELTAKYLSDLFESQNQCCALTGEKIILADNNRKGKGIKTGSLDRIDSNKPYIEGNVQWVKNEINHMKYWLSQERFIELCNLIVENMEKENAIG